MSTFRCSAGHLASFAFADEQVRQPCPTCGVDVYKFRDAVLEDEGLASAVSEASSPPRQRSLLGDTKRARAAAGGACIVALVAVFMLQRSPAAVVPVTSGPVIPLETASTKPAVTFKPAAAPTPIAPAASPRLDDVSITNLSAVPLDDGTVNVSFRLSNRAGTANDYPSLALHWHGAPEADQLITKDAYVHPPLPFTSAEVRLELTRPATATGIDVKLAY
jgi:hypothetical protein